LKEIYKGREDVEDEVSSYWMNLRKVEGTEPGSERSKLQSVENSVKRDCVIRHDE